jgi:hypothetical protein
MKFWTWTEILARLEKELDLDLDYDGLTDETELLNLTNDAIEEAESHIVELNEDYFLKRGTITLVNGQEDYTLPTDCYATKIRGLVYFNNTVVYEIPRIRDWHKFLKYRLARVNTASNEEYRYFLYNDTAGTPELRFSPVPYENGTYVEIWYIRQANRLTTGADKCDIPQFIQFILWHVKAQVLGKDGHPMFQAASSKLDFWRQQMISTLENSVNDGNNEIEPDLSHYDESN